MIRHCSMHERNSTRDLQFHVYFVGLDQEYARHPANPFFRLRNVEVIVYVPAAPVEGAKTASSAGPSFRP
jgi:hypothetical protein